MRGLCLESINIASTLFILKQCVHWGGINVHEDYEGGERGMDKVP